MTRPPKKAAIDAEDAVSPRVQEFAANLSRLRQEKGMTQVDLSDASGINQSHISKPERGVGDPRLSTVLALAAALRVSLFELLPPKAAKSC
ncbi:MAG: helix-turn-helix domain-containing protein [Rhodopila sp.]